MERIPEIIRIYCDIKNGSLKYCKICLRTSNETKLVTPKNFLTFVKALNISFKGEHINICYMCEAQARTTLKFYQQVTFAVFLDMVYYELDSGQNLTEHVIRYINSDNPIKKHKGSYNNLLVIAKDCEVLVKKVRARNKLWQTDTIVVDSNTNGGLPHVMNQNSREVLPPVPTTAPEVVILDDEDDVQQDQNGDIFIINNPTPKPKPLDIEKKDAIIERDERNMPRIVPMATFLASNDTDVVALVPDGNSLIDRHKSSSDHYVLHPVIFGTDGCKYVPSLCAKLNNGKLEKLINCIFQEEDEGVEEIQRCSVVQKKAMSGDTGQNIRGTSDMGHNIRLSCDTGQNKILISDTDESKRVNSDVIKRSSNVEHDGNKTSKSELVIASSSSIRREVSNRSIDWEDKIPMDVISFMDATDPHANEILSLQQAESILPTTHSTVPPPIPVKTETDDMDSRPIHNLGRLIHRITEANIPPVSVVPESIVPTSKPTARHLEISPLITKPLAQASPVKHTPRAYKSTTTRRIITSRKSDIIDLC